MSQVENITLSIYSWCTTSTLHAIHQRKDVHTLTDTKLKTKCWNQSIGPHGIEGQTTSAWTGSRIIHTWPIIYRRWLARWTMLNWLFKAAQLQKIIITCLCSTSWRRSCRTKIRQVGVAGYDITPGWWFRFNPSEKNMTVVKMGDFLPQKIFGLKIIQNLRILVPPFQDTHTSWPAAVPDTPNTTPGTRPSRQRYVDTSPPGVASNHLQPWKKGLKKSCFFLERGEMLGMKSYPG